MTVNFIQDNRKSIKAFPHGTKLVHIGLAFYLEPVLFKVAQGTLWICADCKNTSGVNSQITNKLFCLIFVLSHCHLSKPQLPFNVDV